jgi:uncharacterized membrane protein YdjX (TVP38/TMEM64 family)
MQLQQTHLARKLAALLVFIGLVLLFGHELELYLPDLEVWIEGLGAFAPLGFILLFVILSPIGVSVDGLCFAAGVLFPIVTAEWVVVMATYLSAAVIFFLGRDYVRAKVMVFIAGHKRLAALDKAMSGDNAFKLMLLLRLTPLPFALLSYALSVTEVKFRPYLTATSGILVYNCSLVYFGYATKHLTGLAKGASPAGLGAYFMPIFGLAILIAVLIYVARISGKLLKDMNLENSEN